MVSRSGSKRGFAGIDPAKQKEAASKGGKAAHANPSSNETKGHNEKDGNTNSGRRSMGNL